LLLANAGLRFITPIYGSPPVDVNELAAILPAFIVGT
jgi:hypothetical protein